MSRGRQILYVGTNRFVAALNPESGEELWRTKLPKCAGAGEPVTILIATDALYVGCYGQVYCLDPDTGSVLWRNGLPKMGYHSVLLAMEGTVGGTSPAALATAVRRGRQAAAAAVSAAT